MKRILIIACCLLVSFYKLNSQDLNKHLKPSQKSNPIYGLSVSKPSKGISCEIVKNTPYYLPGAEMKLNFTLNFKNDGLEFIDEVQLIFPQGITPVLNGTSDPLAPHNGCPDMKLQPISGQKVIFGNKEEGDCGALKPGSYSFDVNVIIDPNLTGTQKISYRVETDIIAGKSQVFNGEIEIEEAPDVEVALVATNMANYYDLNTNVIPRLQVRNYGKTIQNFDVTLKINDGTNEIYNQVVNVTDLQLNELREIEFPEWITSEGKYLITFESSLNDYNNENNKISKKILVGKSFDAYVWVAYSPKDSDIPLGPAKITLPSGQINSLKTISGFYVAASDFVNGQWFGITHNSFIITIDKNTGDYKVIGYSGIPSPTGLTYDVTTKTLYATGWDEENSLLYEIDLYTGKPTYIGKITDDLVIAIASNNDGKIYGITLLGDNLISIDKTTGKGQKINSLNINLEYAQDIAFDRNNNILYGALYTANGAIFCTIDLITAKVDTLYTLTSEFTAIAIPYNYVLPENELVLLPIEEITSGCALTEKVLKIKVLNKGTKTQTNIPVYYTVNNETKVEEIIKSTIEPDSSITYTFAKKIDVSKEGKYNIKVCLNLPDDENTKTDCRSTSITHFSPVGTPYLMGFEKNHQNVKDWKAFDVNQDNNTWRIDSVISMAKTGFYSAFYMYSETQPANDWLISTCVELLANVEYGIAFWYKVGQSQGTVFPEKLKVAMGNEQSPYAMTKTLIDMGELTNTTYQRKSVYFKVPENGTYYFGFNVYSDADKYFLAIDNIYIDFSTNVKEYLKNNTRIFPNPTSDVLYIQAVEPIQKIVITNILGQTLYSEVINNNQEIEFNTKNLTNGIYFIHITTNSSTEIKQFVVNKN